MPDNEQNNEEQHAEVLDSLLVGVDIDDDVSRKMAYNACLAHAQQEMNEDPDVNQFVALAAQRLGQVRVHFGVVKGMVALPETARLHLRYDPTGGPVLTGNADGLRYLSDLCAVLVEAPTPEDAPEEHVHLYPGEPPMYGTSFGMTLYHSADIWFQRHAVDTEGDSDTEEEAPDPPPREIDPKTIAAVEFFEDDKIPLPPPLYLRYDKLYRVLSCRSHSPEDEVWEKTLSKSNGSRMYVFTIRDDAQEIFEIALDLDDAGIHYFTRSDLEQLWEVQT